MIQREAIGRLATALLLGVAGGATLVGLLDRPRANPIAITPAPPPPAPTATPTQAPIRVYLSGAVARPDVYALPAGSILNDAVELAGGLSDAADPAQVNLALGLADGQHVHIPAAGTTEPLPTLTLPANSPAPASTAGPAPPAGQALVNINVAGAAELESLPGIGPALADRIIADREANGPFGAIEDIQRVAGIGPAVFADIQALIAVN
ncbi:MAG: helix-hairpin-helix domain-containing protein [Candidatus Promineifilaceae bacterium]